jgi:PAS domain S-box-containing protein/diguanylate cyclase (GGDEF)-like protein
MGDALNLHPDAAIELDAEARLLAANDRALSLFGWTREGQLGLPVEPFLAAGALLAAQEDHVGVRLNGRRANGVPLIIETSVKWRDADNGPRALCCLRELNYAALADEAQRYFDVAFDNAPIGMALFNCDGEYVRVNSALCELLGRPESELLGRRDQELTHPDDRQADVDVAWRILAGELSTHQCEKRFVRPDGSIVWALANLTFLRDTEGRPLSWVGQFQDITARRAAEDATREAEERFRLAFEHAPIGMCLVSPDGRFLRVNSTLCSMVGYTESHLLSATFQDITHPDDLDADLEHVRQMLAGEIRTYEMEKRYIRADGTLIWILLSVSLVRDDDGRPTYFISQIQDIDVRKRAQGELERLALRDPLTGVANRRAWDRELARGVARADATGRPLAVALIDLNDFKKVNDSRGHDAGDELLVRAARAWQAQLRAGDLLARVGGDEFAVLLPECGHYHLAAVVERLKRALVHPAGCAIGAAVWHASEEPSDLMRRADEALYHDKPLTDLAPI